VPKNKNGERRAPRSVYITIRDLEFVTPFSAAASANGVVSAAVIAGVITAVITTAAWRRVHNGVGSAVYTYRALTFISNLKPDDSYLLIGVNHLESDESHLLTGVNHLTSDSLPRLPEGFIWHQMALTGNR
jgi:hypothetical protein